MVLRQGEIGSELERNPKCRECWGAGNGMGILVRKGPPAILGFRGIPRM